MSARRWVSNPVAALAVFALASCGGTTSATSDRDKVTKTLHDYFAALAKRDGAAACSLVTSQVQAQLVRAAARMPGPVPSDCTRAVEKLERGLPQSVLAPLQHVNVQIGTLQGNTAAAHTLGGPIIRRRGLSVVRLEKVGDRWLISAVGR